ncbi:MAG: DMT family transporter [Sphingomonadales bacterium]|nr:DMT family transporter [Sphingomonadales bacterium]
MNAASAPTYAAIMFATGIGIPVMAALNAGLGQRLGSPVAASVVLFAVALACSLLALLLAGASLRGLAGISDARLLGGGCFVAAYVLAVTAIAPRFGLGNAVFFVLIGQMASAAAIDHFALLGAVRSPVTAARALGIALMAAGVFFARRPV